MVIIGYIIYSEKYFSDNHFSYINSPCPNLEGIKMRSATSSDSPRLVRIEVPCAQTRVAIGMERMVRSTACLRGLLSRPPSLGRFDVRTERERRLCSGEFEQLLLTCIKGCGLQSSRFKVCAAQRHAHCDIQLGRQIFCELTVNNSCIYISHIILIVISNILFNHTIN